MKTKFSLLNILLLATLCPGLMVTATAQLSPREQQIEQRIKPVAEVYLAGEQPVAAASADGNTPETVFNTYCSSCHKTGVSGAPILGNKEQWASRIAEGKDVLYKHAIDGKGAMPPRGLCKSCSDDDLKAVVDYMIAKAQ